MKIHFHELRILYRNLEKKNKGVALADFQKWMKKPQSGRMEKLRKQMKKDLKKKDMDAFMKAKVYKLFVFIFFPRKIQVQIRLKSKGYLHFCQNVGAMDRYFEKRETLQIVRALTPIVGVKFCAKREIKIWRLPFFMNKIWRVSITFTKIVYIK